MQGLPIDHVAIAVADIESASQTFTLILGAKPSGREKVESEGVEVCFFNTGDIHLELIAPVDEQSPLHDYIAKKRQGLHHIAFSTSDIVASLKTLEERGVKPCTEIRRGSKGRRVCFFHPKESHGLLWELVENAPA